MMLKTIRNISVVLMVVGLAASCGGKKDYLEPYQLTGAKKATKEGEATKVAFLLPLSGQYAPLGKSMLDAAQLALFDSNVPNLELVPVDTENSSLSAGKAAQKAIDDGAKLILGPVFSPTTAKVQPIAAQKQVNVVSLSNDPALAGKPGLFLLGYTPQQQIKRVTQYAASRGLKDFAALVPNNTYGRMALTEYQNTVSSAKGSLRKTEYYVPSEQVTKLGLQQQVKDVLESLPKEKEAGQYAGAVFVPEGGDRLGTIASWLAGADSGKQVQLLGSGQWDEDKVLKLPEIKGGWYATSDPALHSAFEKRFYDVYGYKPLRIVSLAYDAAALAANLASQQNFAKDAITTPRGFSGVNGAFRFRDNGVSERGLAVLQVDGDATTRLIDPAPTHFD